MNEYVNENETLGLDDIEMENTAVDDLDTEVINLVFLGIDGSGSMDSYSNDMKTALHDFKDAISNSKEVDEILVARANFNNNSIDVGGYKKIDDLNTDYQARGLTPLYDVVTEGSEKLLSYMTFLKEQGMRVKAVFAIFSDGEDTSSRANVSDARKKIQQLNNQEITTAFISFGQEAQTEAQNLDFKNVLEVGSSASELRRAFNVLSKSVIEASKSAVNTTDGDFFDM